MAYAIRAQQKTEAELKALVMATFLIRRFPIAFLTDGGLTGNLVAFEPALSVCTLKPLHFCATIPSAVPVFEEGGQYLNQPVPRIHRFM